MGEPLAPFLGAWTAMMAAMMLPSAAPMILLHRLQVRDGGAVRSVARSAVFAGTYLAVWASIGLAVWAAGRLVGGALPNQTRPYAVAAVLVAAGLYQWSPLKSACLRACRAPMDFLLTHWYRGPLADVRLGAAHGVYCLGCCAALMAVFVAAGAMGLVWAVGIAGLVFVEKILPRGLVAARAAGAVSVIAGIVLAARPELVAILQPAGM